MSIEVIHLDHLPARMEDEYLDLTCPFCNGVGEEYLSDFCEHCSGEGQAEIMWNYAFRLDRPLKMAFRNANMIAWSNGFHLVEDRYGVFWLLARSCGYDFSWRRANAVFQLVGWLPLDYADDIATNRGGRAFVSKANAMTLAIAASEALLIHQTRQRANMNDLKRIADAYAHGEETFDYEWENSPEHDWIEFMDAHADCPHWKDWKPAS